MTAATHTFPITPPLASSVLLLPLFLFSCNCIQWPEFMRNAFSTCSFRSFLAVLCSGQQLHTIPNPCIHLFQWIIRFGNPSHRLLYLWLLLSYPESGTTISRCSLFLLWAIYSTVHSLRFPSYAISHAEYLPQFMCITSPCWPPVTQKSRPTNRCRWRPPCGDALYI